MKNYDHPGCSLDDFLDDLNRVKYILKLFRKFNETGEVNISLLLNHIIIFTNTFGIEAGTNMLMYRLNNENELLLNTFLEFLGLTTGKETIDWISRDLNSL